LICNGADYGITGYVPEEIDDSMPENSTMVQGHDYYLTINANWSLIDTTSPGPLRNKAPISTILTVANVLISICENRRR
jgi:hypothetical protein